MTFIQTFCFEYLVLRRGLGRSKDRCFLVGKFGKIFLVALSRLSRFLVDLSRDVLGGIPKKSEGWCRTAREKEKIWGIYK